MTVPSTCSSAASARSSVTMPSIRPLFEPYVESGTASSGAGMSDRPSTSIFGKLVAVMLTMAACLLLLVGGFFWFIVSPTVSTSIDRVLEEHARTIAASAPTLGAAQRLSAPLDLQ